MYDKYTYDLTNTKNRVEEGPIDNGALITANGATSTQTGSDLTNNSARGVKVVLYTGTIAGSITVSIEGKDKASGQYYVLLTGTAVTGSSVLQVYTVYPGLTAVANTTASDVLPAVWRVVVQANNTGACTYTVGASLLS